MVNRGGYQPNENIALKVDQAVKKMPTEVNRSRSTSALEPAKERYGSRARLLVDSLLIALLAKYSTLPVIAVFRQDECRNVVSDVEKC